MKSILKNFILNLMPVGLKRSIQYPTLAGTNIVLSDFVNLSFSQEGEDLVLSRLLGEKKSGFFVDVGAHHPLRFSNTYKFYLQGWRGINIDPLPNGMELFNKIRPEDTNLEIAILEQPAVEMQYYVFDEPALNTFDKDLALARSEGTHYKLIGHLDVPCYRLAEVLDMHLPAGQTIDFLTIDVEGMDLQVLRSNDWFKFRPNYIVVESLCTSLENDLKSELNGFLVERDYILVSKTSNTLIYRLKC